MECARKFQEQSRQLARLKEIDERGARNETLLREMKMVLSEIHTHVFVGNGRPGIVSQVEINTVKIRHLEKSRTPGSRGAKTTGAIAVALGSIASLAWQIWKAVMEP